MADNIDSTKHDVLNEISKLQEQQAEDLRNAVFLGWTPDLLAAHEKRKRLLAELWRELLGRDAAS